MLDGMYMSISIFKCVQGGCFCNNKGTKNNDHDNNNNSDASTLSNPQVPGTPTCDLRFSQRLIGGGAMNHFSPIRRLRHRGGRLQVTWLMNGTAGNSAPGRGASDPLPTEEVEGSRGNLPQLRSMSQVMCHLYRYRVCVGPLAQ